MKSTQAIRRMLVIVCLVAPLSVPGISSASTISGTNCRKEGLLRQVGDAKFLCTRAKKGKLRWRLQTATPTGDPKSTMKPNGTTPSKATNTTTNTTTKTAPSTAKRPGKQEPATGTTTATPTGDPNRIIDNGYINLDGVRVSAVNTGFKGREIYEKCGWIGEGTIKLWFKYANGLVLDERWVIFGRQTHVFIKDMFGEPAWRGVVVEASGLDPYGDSWTEENGYARTEWIWCANLKPIKE